MRCSGISLSRESKAPFMRSAKSSESKRHAGVGPYVFSRYSIVLALDSDAVDAFGSEHTISFFLDLNSAGDLGVDVFRFF